MTREENELLTRVGPSTPMGELMRRFWIPFMISRELTEADSDPARVTLLNENLIVFRDSSGRVGLVDEQCPHRLASLFFARNEEGGLRCVYHGWKFDVDGACIEVPSEPPPSDFRTKVTLRSYPVREVGGILWTYMGPADTAGDIPELEWLKLPETHRYISRWHTDCNYVQNLDGEVDPVHVGWLHRRFDMSNISKASSFGSYVVGDGAPKFVMRETEAGFACGARRTADGGKDYWRVNPFMLPFYTMVAPVESVDGYMVCRAWVPVSDEVTQCLSVTYHPDRPLTETEIETFRTGKVAHAVVIPGTLRPKANRDNDYLIDREMQRKVNFTGISETRVQDAAVAESAGPIADRSREFLAPGDLPLVTMRRRLMRAAQDLKSGKPIRQTAGGRLYGIRPWAGLLDSGLKGFDADPDVARAMRVVPEGSS